MKTQLEQKLNKLPLFIDQIINSKVYRYHLEILPFSYKDFDEWMIRYREHGTDNTIIEIIKESLEELVDVTLHELKTNTDGTLQKSRSRNNR